MKDYGLKNETIVREWGWALPLGRDIQVVEISQFGNILLISDGKCFLIVPEDLECNVICVASEMELLWGDDQFVERWLMSSWKTTIEDVLGPIPENKVIAFITPRTLGGGDSVKNVYFADINDYVGGMGSIAKQIANLPNGSEVVLKIK